MKYGAFYCEEIVDMSALTQLELGKKEEVMTNMKKAAELYSPQAKQFLEQQGNK